MSLLLQILHCFAEDSRRARPWEHLPVLPYVRGELARSVPLSHHNVSLPLDYATGMNDSPRGLCCTAGMNTGRA